MKLILIDLDHLLLRGDSDALWVEFLRSKGLLDEQAFSTRRVRLAAADKAGTRRRKAYADFYLRTLAGRSLRDVEPLRQEFFANWLAPRLRPSALALVARHHAAGDLVVMSTATNRFIAELAALYCDIEHLIATEPHIKAGAFTGERAGRRNHRRGKLKRLRAWLQARGLRFKDCQATAYSNALTDLPLLEAVHQPVTVNAGRRLSAIAARRGWRGMHWD